MNDLEERLNRALNAQADAFEHASGRRDLLGDVRPLRSATSARRRPFAAAASALATAAAVLAVTVAMSQANDRGAVRGPVRTVASTSAAASTSPAGHGKRNAVISGIVTTRSGRPVGGVTVVATFAHTAVTAETKPDGTFTLRGLPNPATVIQAGLLTKVVRVGPGEDRQIVADSTVALALTASPTTRDATVTFWAGEPTMVHTHR